MLKRLNAFVLGFFFVLSSALQAKVDTAKSAPLKTDVVIVGSGLSGLATAYELKKLGIKYHIMEVLPRVGGRVRTVRYQRPGKKEVYADSGMEEYWESNPAVKLLKELKLPTRHDVAVSSIVLGDKLQALGDEEPAEFYKRIFSKTEYEAISAFKLKVAPIIHKLHETHSIPPEYAKLKDISFAKWLEKEKIPKRVRDWIRVSIECEMGYPIDRVSAIDGIAEFHIFLGEGEMSYRVNGGNVIFAEGLANAVGGSNISLNKRVQKIENTPTGTKVYYLDEENSINGVIEAAHVVTTIPLYRMLLEVQFEPSLSQKKIAAINSMTWGSYFKVHIFVPPEAENIWIKGDASMLPILSDSNLGVIYDGNPDQSGRTRIISLLTYGDHAERFNFMPLDQVRAEISKNLDRFLPGISAKIEDMQFYRYHPRAIAAWPVGRSRFDEGANEVRKPEGHIFFAGDFTESTHSSGAFAAAFRAVAQIKEQRK